MPLSEQIATYRCQWHTEPVPVSWLRAIAGTHSSNCYFTAWFKLRPQIHKHIDLPGKVKVGFASLFSIQSPPHTWSLAAPLYLAASGSVGGVLRSVFIWGTLLVPKRCHKSNCHQMVCRSLAKNWIHSIFEVRTETILDLDMTATAASIIKWGKSAQTRQFLVGMSLSILQNGLP